MGVCEVVKMGVIKFTTHATLECFDGRVELSMYVRMKLFEFESFKLEFEGIDPNVLCEVVN